MQQNSLSSEFDCREQYKKYFTYVHLTLWLHVWTKLFLGVSGIVLIVGLTQNIPNLGWYISIPAIIHTFLTCIIRGIFYHKAKKIEKNFIGIFEEYHHSRESHTGFIGEGIYSNIRDEIFVRSSRLKSVRRLHPSLVAKIYFGIYHNSEDDLRQL